MSETNKRIPASAAPAIVTTRVFAVAPATLFGAFSDPALLAKWWGPQDFTNTVQEYDFRPGGAWRITMRAPGGSEFPNESRFLEVVPPERIVFEHIGPMHRYWMTMEFAAVPGGTRLTWHMQFETVDEYTRLKDFIGPANEQNFNRLAACVSGQANPVR